MTQTHVHNDVDKDQLYGRYQAGIDAQNEDRREKNKWAIRVAHKALDMAPEIEDEPVNVNVDRRVTSNGVGTGWTWKEMAVLGGTIVAGLYMWSQSQNPVAPAPVPGPADSAYDVTFYDSDGNVIPLKQKPSTQQE